MIDKKTREMSERDQAEQALQESETKYRLLFENMEEGFSLHEIIQDENGKVVDFRFLDVNKAYERHTGMKQDGLMGKTMLEVMPQADRQQIEAYGRVALTGEPLQFEYYSKTFDRTMRVKAFCPQPGRFATIFEDIAERKQAERDLKESEEKYRILFNNAIYAVCIFDQQTAKLIDVNDAFIRQYGYSRDELLAGMTVYDITAELQKSKEAVQQAIRTEGLFIPLCTHRKKDGTAFPVEIVVESYTWQGKTCANRICSRGLVRCYGEYPIGA